MKSWESINREYEEELEQLRERAALNERIREEEKKEQTVKQARTVLPEKKKRSSRVSVILSNVFFFGAIIFLLFATIMVSSGDNSSGSILGYRYFHILTSSMNSVYPKGSFVIVKEKADIEIGDDITFYTDPNTTVTHRVIDIVEDYEGTGAKGYETQGTENLNPDPDINHEGNVVGKVVYCIPKLGNFMEFIKEHMIFVFAFFIMIIVISLVFRMLLASRRRERQGWIQVHRES